MGYLFLSIALIAGITKGYCGKKASGYTRNFRDAILANTIRMVFCIIIGFILIVTTEDIRVLIPNRQLLFITALSGISTAIFVASWLVCVKKSAYMMIDIFLMLGVLVPLIASSLWFGETVKLTQWFGIGILLLAVFFMCSYNNSIKAKLTLPAFLLLLICGISCGLADFSQKLFMKAIPDGSVAVFNFYTYLFASVALIAAFVFSGKSADSTTIAADFKKIFGFIVAMSVCLFVSSYFQTLAAGLLSAVLLYPLSKGLSLILSTMMVAIFFKEKLTYKAIIGICVAFIGLLMINLL